MHNPHGGALSRHSLAMMIVALSECEPCAVFLQSEANFLMVKFLRMTGYAKILHRGLPLLNTVMPTPIDRRLAIRQALDRIIHRARFGPWWAWLSAITLTGCPRCRTIRLLLILGVGLILGLFTVG